MKSKRKLVCIKFFSGYLQTCKIRKNEKLRILIPIYSYKFISITMGLSHFVSAVCTAHKELLLERVNKRLTFFTFCQINLTEHAAWFHVTYLIKRIWMPSPYLCIYACFLARHKIITLMFRTSPYAPAQSQARFVAQFPFLTRRASN